MTRQFAIGLIFGLILVWIITRPKLTDGDNLHLIPNLHKRVS